MLGWEFFVAREAEADADVPALASWRAGMSGTKWLDDLVTSGVAKDLGGNGYPCRYSVPAGALLAAFARGAPKHAGPLVIGDDYVLPGGWTADLRIDLAALQSLDPHEELLVEAWDQS